MSDGVCIHVAAGEFAAQQIKAFLAANDIPSDLIGEALRNTHGLTLDGLGGVRILVPEADADQARDLLAQVESGEMELGENLPE